MPKILIVIISLISLGWLFLW